ncbi:MULTISPECIES: adenylate/guanylate cyclase domain-containing protein [Agrobacterium tumefaciens complex]|uniref:adenylate/guanylate cyclase domain-containing protein n=1 Tax=Agrobacterium tumefaciens complex TaxID=1183400 RepID=UPI0021D24CF7|nr:adenylate/guanylate cyclase domain-containing protein [Agrobacterium tumefaciens]UXS24254.1 transcriptional regulator [Agrobacterium tumefaciens]UXS52420.1 transcriptional regulator [Agrobacterium tumefaciens]UXS62666.1 transcriptional regulator [Agrobacterium tumefaciens]
MANSWKHDRAKTAIDARIKDVENVTVVDYTRTTSLQSIPTNKAYRLDGVHLYIDIVNFEEMLWSTDTEGQTSHKRALRFLNLHYRAVHRILADADAIRVDFHNQRLHAVIAKPYGTDAAGDRVDRAVAIAKLIVDVLAETGDDDENIPNAKVRVGIDTGKALAVNNGRNGYREPLFLGRPANIAAKLASNNKVIGIYLSNDARDAIDLDTVDVPAKTKLTDDEIAHCEDNAQLGLSKDSIVREWRKDNENNPIGSFSFSRATPPLKNLDITVLTPGNSRRMDMVSVYADVDNFTAYVDSHIDDDAEDVVRCLHVIRAELDRVLTSDFSGRRIRFIGDCVHGHILEGTAYTTDTDATISTAVLCAGGLRSSFDLALERLQDNGVDTDDLGLAIGFDFGPGSITRLGMQGSRVRCSAGRSVLLSEAEQKRCDGTQTAIGQSAYDEGPSSVRKLFGSSRRVANLTYDVALEALAAEDDSTAKAARAVLYAAASPAIARAAETPFRPHAKID